MKLKETIFNIEAGIASFALLLAMYSLICIFVTGAEIFKVICASSLFVGMILWIAAGCIREN
jgi:hypothetical protein